MAQTQADFASQLNTIFRVSLGTSTPVELKLVTVKGHESEEYERPDMERFSLLFSGPSNFFLSQQTYRMKHEEMGELDIFLVPIGRESDTFLYEAVFNFYKPAD